MSEPKNEISDNSFEGEYNRITQQRRELEVAEELLVNKAVSGDNPNDIVKAMNVVNIKKNEGTEHRKSTFVDPFAFDQSFGYKSVPNRLTYSTLLSMSKVPIINSIVKTRKTQVAAFSQPQKDRFSTGFIVRKKGQDVNANEKLSSEDRKRIDEVTEFILNCGENHSWSRPDFDNFLRIFVEDSLIYDQGCFEIVRDLSGGLSEFLSVDSTTIRIADSFSDSDYKGEDRVEVAGHYPSYVQMVGSQSYAEFYPWELCFGTRNPTSRLYSNGYGRSELEDMVTLTTSMLWSDQYNRNFFRQGAAPKGILRIKGGTNNARVQEFRQQWKAMVAGVDNAWRTPVIDSESMEWIDLQKGHKDMEYGKWQEYLVKLSCALYTIDPTEIGFTSGQSADGGAQFESNNAQKLKYSKDKGLKPLLKYVESKINKYIVSQLYEDLVFEFVGLDAETEEQFRQKIEKEVTLYKTINEIREEQGLKKIDGGDIVANATFMQGMQMKQQEEMMAQQGGEEGGEEDGGYEEDGGEEEEPSGFSEESGMGDLAQGAQDTEKGIESNPFTESFNDMIDKLEHGDV